MKNLCTKSAVYCGGALLLLAVTGLTQPATAALTGPTQTPPLGVIIADSETLPAEDPGYGEDWGRKGGRIKTHTVAQPGAYNQLLWQAFSAKIALDGNIDDPGETLSLISNVNGQAIWQGSTTIEVLQGSTYVPEPISTEFVLTVEDINGAPVSLVMINGAPAIDLKALPVNGIGDAVFTTILEMEAVMPPTSSVTAICPTPTPTAGYFEPVLDVYDCLHTNPANDRPVITSFDSGFLYEMPFMDLTEHDLHMENLVTSVQNTVDETNMWTDFLVTDWQGRIPALSVGQSEINGKLDGVMNNANQVSDTVDQINITVGQINDTLNNNQGDPNSDVLDQLIEIKEGVNKVPDFNLLMFGLEDFIQDPELKGYVPFVIQQSPLYQSIRDVDQKVTSVLNQSETDLDNLTDLLSQISGQAQQNGAAISSLATQITGLNTIINEKNDEIVNLNAIIAARNAEIAALNTAIAARDADITGLNTIIAAREGEITALKATISAKNGEIAALKADIAAKDGEIADLNATIAARDSEIATLNALIADQEQHIAVLTTINTDNSQTIDSLVMALLDDDAITADIASRAHDKVVEEIAAAIAAGGNDKKIAKAEKAVQRGEVHTSNGDYDEAVEKYGKALSYIRSALNHEEHDKGHGNDDDHHDDDNRGKKKK
jgi:septal ring factor EnvC (AmiA/AmiB activator)